MRKLTLEQKAMNLVRKERKIHTAMMSAGIGSKANPQVWIDLHTKLAYTKGYKAGVARGRQIALNKESRRRLAFLAKAMG